VAIYSVTTHPALSGKAREMVTSKIEQFDAGVLLAETLLKLTEPALTDVRKAAQAALAVAMQVNWQIELGIDPFFMSSESTGKMEEAVSYRSDVPLVDPRAAQLAAVAMGSLDPWGDGLTSVRGPIT
jgi:hypothetical protein